MHAGDGSRDAFAQVYEMFGPLVYGIVRRVLTDPVVTEEITQLPEPRGTVVARACFDGRTDREVAAELDLPDGTAKALIRDGLLQLRDLLGSET